MKKLLSTLVIIALLVGLLGAIPVSAAGAVNVWVGSTNVIINDSVTVTIIYNGGGEGIGSLDAKFYYNTETFEYLSCTGATANGGAGVVTISYYSMEATPSDELTVTLKLKAIKPGDGNFKLTTAELCSDENTLLANHVKTVDVTASEPTLSDNANLKSLVPSRGTLTPKFSPDVTEYTISVANSVESLSLSVTTADADAKTSISGKNALTVGKNTRVITVTAPKGNTKKYTVVITRAAAPTTTAGSSNNSTTPTVTTPTLPAEDTLEVSVDGKTMTVLDTQASVDLPDGFSWSNLTINRVEVPAAVNKTTGMTLLYLVGEDKADEGFYIYDTDADLLTRYRPLDTTVNHYLIYNPPADRPAPAGTTLGQMPYTNHYVGAYVYEDAALKDFYVLWAAPMGGEADWYTYDKKEGTLQRYHATPGSGEQVVLPTTKPTTITKKTTSTDSEKKFSFGSLFSKYDKVIFFILIGLGGVLVLGLIVILLIAVSKRNRGKH